MDVKPAVSVDMAGSHRGMGEPLAGVEPVVLDCRMEFLELQRLEGPAEVFAVDVGVPDYEV